MTSDEIWDFRSGNGLAEYPRRSAALTALRNEVRAYRPKVGHGSALLRVDTRGESRPVSQGEELIRLRRLRREAVKR